MAQVHDFRPRDNSIHYERESDGRVRVIAPPHTAKADLERIARQYRRVLVMDGFTTYMEQR